MDKLRVDLEMSRETVDRLLHMNFYLYAFRAVESSESGLPVVGYSTKLCTEFTSFMWGTRFGAYASEHGKVAHGTQIIMDTFEPIDLSQKLEVTEPLQSAVVDGMKGCITVWNHRSRQLPACGIGEYINEEFSAICAFEIGFGNSMVTIKPIEKVFLMLAYPIKRNTVIAQSNSPGILIDLTDKKQARVKYDADGGWSGEGEQIDPGVPIGPILVLPTSEMENLKAKVLSRV